MKEGLVEGQNFRGIFLVLSGICPGAISVKKYSKIL